MTSFTNIANDTSNRATNATHSLVIVSIGEEFLVSCFGIGADGTPDMDREVFVEAFTDGHMARRFFSDKAGLLACNAAKFDAEIDWVYRCLSSLESCLCREVPNEARRLAVAVAELELATLARRNANREERKAKALARAADTLARRMNGLDAKIKTEAAARVCMGQP